MLTDYHVHIENGDYNLDWLQKFLNKAKEVTIDDLGIAEHSFRFLETAHIYENEYWDERRTVSIKDYFKLLDLCNKTGENIKKGIEIDYIPGKERLIDDFLKEYDFDYVIGSIHWLGDWGFDIPWMKSIWEKKDIKKVYLEYFDLVGKLAESKLFNIVGHFDIIKIFGYEPVFDEDILKAIEDTIRKIKDNDMCVEINTAGLDKPIGEIYPKKSWLELFYEFDVPIVLASDAHYPEDVGSNFSKALALVKEVGYDKIAVFKDRSYKLMPLG